MVHVLLDQVQRGAFMYSKGIEGGAMPTDPRVLDRTLSHFRLRRTGGAGAAEKSVETDFADITGAIEFAVREFGAGEVEIVRDGLRAYLLQVHTDRTWFLRPAYRL